MTAAAQALTTADRRYALKMLRSEYGLDVIFESRDPAAPIISRALKDRDFVLRAFKDDRIKTSCEGQVASIMAFAPEEFRSDRRVVLAAVTRSGLALQYADPKFFSDREIVLAAMKSYSFVLHIYGFGEKFTKTDAWRTWASDREIVLAAVSSCGRSLKYASRRLRADREIVMAAIQNDGKAVKYASPALRAEFATS